MVKALDFGQKFPGLSLSRVTVRHISTAPEIMIRKRLFLISKTPQMLNAFYEDFNGSY